MLVGTAISELHDTEGNQMKFSVQEVDTADGKWYRSLVRLDDKIGSIEDLASDTLPVVHLWGDEVAHQKTNNKHAPALANTAASSKIVTIEEINDDAGSEDEDLAIYEKPDSDASDEDEDPTLVRRDKPTAPV